MPYVLRKNGFEIRCDTVDEARALIDDPAEDAEGDEEIDAAVEALLNGDQHLPPNEAQRPTSGEALAAHRRRSMDRALLRKLVRAQGHGIQSSTIAILLEARGKALPGAFDEWMGRVGLPPESVEPTRVGMGRGWRLTKNAWTLGMALIDEARKEPSP